MSGNLPLQMRWCRNVSKEKKSLPVAVRSLRTSVLKLPILLGATAEYRATFEGILECIFGGSFGSAVDLKNDD